MGAFEDSKQSNSLYSIREKRLGVDKKMGFGTLDSNDEKKNVEA